MTCHNTTINPNCQNPYEYLLFEAVGTEIQGPPQSSSSPQEVLDRFLDKGIVMNSNCDLCCPDCNNIHIIASVETAMKALTGQYWNGSSCQPYFNYSLECETSTAVFPGGILGCNGNSINQNYSKCCNGFTEGAEDLFCIAKRHTSESGFIDTYAEVVDRILDKGILEYGTIQGESQVKYLVQWLSQIEGMIPNITTQSYAETIDRILDKGIVVWCDKENEKYVISSVETFIKMLPCTDSIIEFSETGETCCLNVKASVEAYLKFEGSITKCSCGVPA